ncbi:ABC transporter substrate-binding protein [Pelagicoccus albus]|uniref:ABC transporter substrate-binding protein n=1 Tax=Pelagicoccus albus TaxID=415222 RepID=A0A7X1EA62_9BACT|nr:ABC transporter substrate-binding protein [Pelagicoccus albus]MBC2607923.1 ABC transporter substrate-binding protein [Pelagicoccus albus]
MFTNTKYFRQIFNAKVVSSLGLASSLVFLVGCGNDESTEAGDESALTPVSIQTDWYAQPEHGGFYQAKVAGIYEEAGLDVTISQGGPNSNAVMKVARGQMDFGIGRLDDIALRIEKGLDIVIVSALMQHDPQALLLHADNPISKIAELDDQRIMITPGSVMVQMMEKKYDLSIRIQPLDFGIGRFLSDPGYIQQCFVTSEPYFARKNGVESKVILISDLGFDPYRVIFANRTMVEEKPDVVAAFVAATIEGWSDYVDEATDRSAANAMISTENKIMDDPELLAFCVQSMRDYNLIHGIEEEGDANGLLRKARIQEAIDLMVELDILETITQAEDVYTTEFLPENLQSMLSDEEKVPFQP